MTDNKKETNQKPKHLKGKNPNVSIFDGQQANLALIIEAFRGLKKKQHVMIINYLQMLR